MEVIKKGSIEPLMVALRDRLENISNLGSVTDPKFDVRRKRDNAVCQSDVVWTYDPDFPMTAVCLIDTTQANYTAGDEFKLYLKYVAGSESAVKGPLFFRVEDD
jgi:hypothetical protein